MAQDGSCAATAANAFTVSGKKNECSIATARLNCACAAALHETGKLTSPSFSSCARAAGCPSTTTRAEVNSTHDRRMRAMAFSSIGPFDRNGRASVPDASNAFIVSLFMQKYYYDP